VVSGGRLPGFVVVGVLHRRDGRLDAAPDAEGIGIDLRAHMENRVWLSFFDALFCVSSALLAIFFGAALGNVIRGVPLGGDHYFFEPLWADFQLGAHPGILDWYTVMARVVALVTLTAYGALYVALKTDGELGQRARRRPWSPGPRNWH
jgi:cytochrome d ubiquinol oxidase subunit II